MHVVATAGHVDHGKSTLVRALTGRDPDRLAEEKARGLTIDLGFAWTTLPSGRDVAFIDVPGHVRFIKNMLAGVGAVDACLFVVDTAEGWKPQSEEHLRILDLLGVSHGVVALTRAAGSGPAGDAERTELVELRRLEVEERVAGTVLEGSPIVAVDAPAGMGLDDLVRGLDTMLAATPEAADRGRPRLWIDRSFALRGTGTVVTGTLTGGQLLAGDRLEVVPGPAPSFEPRAVRVRGLQTQERPVEAIGPGRRVAVNVAGAGQGDRGAVTHNDLARGAALVRPSQWAPATVFDATLVVLASAPASVGRNGRGAFQAHIGSGEHAVRLRVLGKSELQPGASGCVRLRLATPLPLLPGDRYVLRDSGRSATVGGGVILDVAPVRRPSRATPDRSVDRVVAERGWVDVALLERLTGERRAASVGGCWVVSPEALAEAETTVRTAVEGAGRLGLDVSELGARDRAVLAELVRTGEAVLDRGRAVAAVYAGTGGAAGALAGHPYLRALEAAPFAPPDPTSSGVDRAELAHLVRSGLVVERDGHYFSTGALTRAAERMAALLADYPGGVTVAAVRTALGSSRKHVLPLLALLDATGVTRRVGDLRIAGPRMPAATGST